MALPRFVTGFRPFPKPQGRKERQRCTTLEVESLETRALPNVAPVFNAITGGSTLSADAALTLGIDGFDADAHDALAISVVVKDSSPGLLLDTFVHSGNRFATMNYVRASDGMPIGSVVVELFEKRGALAAQRFILLATRHVETGVDGLPIVSNPTPAYPAFYADVPVHRVEDLTGLGGYIFQSGDAANGDGTGASPLPDFNDEFDSFLGFNGEGVLAAANDALLANSNNSQWFITAGPTQQLNQRHEVFGQVVAGMDVVDQIIGLGSNGSILQNVIIGPSPHDGSISVRARDGTGGTATLTLTLNDGKGHTTSQDVPITVLGSNAAQTHHLGTGTSIAIDPQFAGTAAQTFTVSASLAAPLAGATANYDTGSGLVNVVSPAAFFGAFDVNVTVTRADGYHATKQFHVTRENFYSPVVAGAAPASFGSNPMQAAIGGYGLASEQVGNRLYVAAGGAGLEVYSLANSANPRLLGRFNTVGFARDVKVVGTIAYIADESNGLVSVDVKDPLNMKQLGQVAMPSQIDEGATPPATTPTPGLAIGLVIQGTTAYVASYHAGLTVVNIAKPAAMTVTRNVKFLEPPVPVGQTRASILYACDIARKGDLLYVTDFTQGILVFDRNFLSKPNGGLVAYVPGSFWGLAVTNRVYAVRLRASQADLTKSLHIFGPAIVDPPGPSLPTLMQLGAAIMPEGAVQVAVAPDGKQAVVGTQGGYALVNVANPKMPGIVATVNTVTASGSTLFGGGGVASFGPGNRIALPVAAGATQVLAPVFSGTQTFIDSNGVKVTVTMIGGKVRVLQDETGRIDSIDVLQSTRKAILTIATVGGSTTIGRLRVGDPTDPADTTSIGIISAPAVHVTGDVHIGGSIQSLRLGDVSGSWTVGGTAGALVVRSTGPLWNAAFAGPVAGFRTLGNFSGDLVAPAVATFKVGGDMVLGSLTLTRPVDPAKPKQFNAAALTVAGVMNGSRIASQGHVGTVLIGAMTNSQIHVGLQAGVSGLPDTNDFNATLARAVAISVKGLPEVAADFSASVIAAGRLGTVTLINVQPNNGGTAFGVVAGSIGKYIRKQGKATVKAAANVIPIGGLPTVIESSATLPTLADFIAQVVPMP